MFSDIYLSLAHASAVGIILSYYNFSAQVIFCPENMAIGLTLCLLERRKKPVYPWKPNQHVQSWQRAFCVDAPTTSRLEVAETLSTLKRKGELNISLKNF
jgi:hypothetical protein